VSKRRTRPANQPKTASPNQHRTPSTSEPEKTPFWRRPMVWLGGVATVVVAGVLINVLTPPAQRLTSSPEPMVTVVPLNVIPQMTPESKRRGSKHRASPTPISPPLSVASEDPLNLDDLGVWFFPGKLVLSPSELAHANSLGHENDSMASFANYFYSLGGYAQNADTQLVLQNDSNQPVKILDLRVVKNCQPPLTGTLIWGPNVGGDGDVRIGFNLDLADTDAESATGWNTTAWKPNYFENYNISFGPGEQRVLNIRAVSSKLACTFRYRATVLEGKMKFYQTIDDGGQPFRVSAFVAGFHPFYHIKFSDYAALYIGGVASPPDDHGSFVRVNPKKYFP
jgi:hypothetical protein